MFRDITPVLQDPKAFKEVIDSMCETVHDMNPDVIVGIESRGFVLGAPIAMELGLGFVPVRKDGKLPDDTIGPNTPWNTAPTPSRSTATQSNPACAWPSSTISSPPEAPPKPRSSLSRNSAATSPA